MTAAGESHTLCRAVCPSGRVCGLPAHPEHEGLCPYHVRAAGLKKSSREENLLEELRSPAGDYITQIDINHVLGKLFDALAENRISVERAHSLAHIAELLLRSQEGAKREVRHWKEDVPTYQAWLRLKYPFGRPGNADAVAAEERFAESDEEVIEPVESAYPPV